MSVSRGARLLFMGWFFNLKMASRSSFDGLLAILYPLFAALSAAVYMWATRHHHFGALLGASGAISGLAGMYFILFPVQRVRMLAFLNLWLLTAFCCLSKPFWIRGFWLLLLWFLWGDVVPVVFGWDDGTAHWAHLGGFVGGMVVALGLLFAYNAALKYFYPNWKPGQQTEQPAQVAGTAPSTQSATTTGPATTQEAADLMEAFADPSIAGIITSIGGDDSIRLIPHLDLAVIAANPKVFLGFSDTTTLHFACLAAGVTSFYGPAVMAGFGENAGMQTATYSAPSSSGVL